MEQLSAILFIIALFGGVHDLLTKRIPNWWTFPIMLFGLGFYGWWQGWSGLSDSLLGIGIGFALFAPLYLFHVLGAGDVKLLMALGAWGGPNFVFQVAVASILLGGVYAFLEVLFTGRFLPFFIECVSFFRSLFSQKLVPPNFEKKRKFSFGLFMAGATALVIEMEGRFF